MQGAASGADLSRLDASIEDLISRQSERLTFLHPSWLRTWLAEFGAGCEPLVLTCGDGNLVGFAPLMRADDRLTFIGDASICDFMDVMVDPDNADAAYEALWHQLSDQDWREIELWGLMESSPTRERLKSYAAHNGYTVQEIPEAVSPRLELPATWEDYLASLGKKDRHELRRKIRRLYDSGGSVDFDVLSSQEDVVAAMDDFLALVQPTFSASLATRLARHPGMSGRMRDLAGGFHG